MTWNKFNFLINMMYLVIKRTRIYFAYSAIAIIGKNFKLTLNLFVKVFDKKIVVRKRKQNMMGKIA
jgi:hypothetical protein